VSARAWLQAARPLALVNIAVPLLLGQGLAMQTIDRFSWALCGMVLLAGVLDQLFIVFANDVADEEGDRAHEQPTPFSGGSRVLVEGKLSAGQLRNGARIAAVGLVVVAMVTAYGFARPWIVPLWAAGIALLWAYSYPPFRLSYRGFGEVAQGLGVGIILPLIGYYAQVGSFEGFHWPALAPMFLLGFASNITTALPDMEADAACDKKTWPVRFGLHRARKHALQVTAVAVFMTPFVLPNLPRWSWAAVEALPALVLLVGLIELKKDGPLTYETLVRAIVINGAAANLVMLGWLVAALTVTPLVL
jgi:1,4-dihydroxy-2-naphthoate octaprenyltransferase